MLSVPACKATKAELDAARCDPKIDLEQCDNTGTRRRQCNPANGQWFPIQECLKPQICQELYTDKPGQLQTVCQVPDDGDVVFTSGDTSVLQDGKVTAQDTEISGKTDVVSAKDGAADAPSDSAAGTDAGAEVADTDVGGPVSIPKSACLNQHCPSQMFACQQQNSCTQAISIGMNCMIVCGGGQSCFSQCQYAWSGNSLAFNVASCGALICSGGCGDGECASSESAQTCPKDCKPATTGSCSGFCGGMSTDCHCDPPCLKAGDCCADYAKACP